MIARAGPIAVGVSMLNDRRCHRRDPKAELDDDEVSDLDLTPETIGEGRVPEPSAQVRRLHLIRARGG